MRRIIVIGLVLAIVAALTPSAALAQGTGRTHIVQPGENLYRIALRYGVPVSSLAMVNGITNPTMVYVGQTLVIPSTGSNAAAPPAPSSAPAATAGTHTVVAGETLFRIALQHGVTTNALAAANGIKDPRSIYAGQVLKIPGGSPAGAAPAAGAPPALGLPGGPKKIVVSISQQHLWAYSGDRVAYSFVASTGLATSPTKPGTFQVLDKIPNAYASTWNLQMPYWLGIYYVGRIENGIHALPILSNGAKLWAGVLGRPVSFGCIVLDTQAARQLYEWVDVGTTVVVQP